MNKLMLLMLALFCTILPSIAQDHYQQLYDQKIESFTKLRNNGYAMIGSGAGLAITGAIIIATLPEDYWTYNDDDNYYYDDNHNSGDDTKVFVGIVSIGLGVGLLAGGITMSSIGSHKIKQYQGKVNTLSFGIKGQGLTLTYKF